MISNYILNFGPQHPAAHGVLRLILELEGEKIKFLDPHIGFLHRGTEKLIEHNFYFQSIPYFDRLDYVSMLSQEHSFILAIELLLNLKVSKKTKIIRTMMDEITRLLNHIMCITTHALDIGALTPFLWGFEEREKLIKLYENLSGARMHAAYYRIGGVFQDLPDFFLTDILLFIDSFLSYINILNEILSTNPIWISRLSNIGILTKKKCLNYSASGPVIRGSGIPWDIRKLQPYEFYNFLNFNIPLGYSNDAYSRYYVRLFEMLESLKLIKQCVNSLLALSKKSFTENITSFFSKNSIKYDMENLIYHFKHFSSGIQVPYGSGGIIIYIK